MLTSDQKGSAAELGIIHHAARLGISVLRPVTDGNRYDLIFDLGGHLLRVQCKAAAHQGDVLVVNFRSCRRSAAGFIRRGYAADEVDLVAAHCLELSPTKNNQRHGINWAKDFEFAARLGTLGP